MERDMNNKIVVVTGAADGIGFHITKQFIKAGARSAVILDINGEKGRKAAEELTTQYGPNSAVFIKCDVLKDLDEVYEKICEQFGKIDVLVNNTGLVNETVPEKCIDINLTATIKWSLKFLEHMRKDKNGNGGTIVNIASILGYRVDYFCPVYHASKFGVNGFTKSLGHKKNYNDNGVRVIAICPGFTKTNLTKFILDGNSDTYVNINNSYVWQSPENVGENAVEVFKVADSGTIWVIEGGEMKEVI